ncbi:MAG: FecR domain-containing protein [Anaerolineae bacterium]|nr:FecR domain-containing protein [Anaerolineae bacterium]
MTRSPKFHVYWLFVCLMIVILMPGFGALAQPQGLAATLEVLAAGVEVRRVDTSNWISVAVESIVGAGDTIRTDDTGRARITFFADGTDVELSPNTEFEVTHFQGTDDAFTIELEVFAGETLQRIGRALGADSRYEVQTPVMTLAARGTVFAIRSEGAERTGMLVLEGTVGASHADESEQVPEAHGVRADDETGLSDVVRASSFAELDAALDGCAVSVAYDDDVSFNVRVQPSGDAPRVGTLLPSEIERVYGVTASGGWYRVGFRDAYGWIRSSALAVEGGCAGLRVFDDDTPPEDAALYSSLGDAVTLDDLLTPPTPIATPASSG